MSPRTSIVSSLLVASAAALAASEAPGILSFEGRLLQADGSPETGQTVLKFRLYDAESAVLDVWNETQLVQLGTQGYYAVQLGIEHDLPTFDGRPYWLGITVFGEQEMVPRTRLASVPYALWSSGAANAARLGGDAASEFLRKWSAVDSARLTGPILVVGGDVRVGSPGNHDLSAAADLLVEGNLVVDGQVIQHMADGSTFLSLNTGALNAAGPVTLATEGGDVGIGTVSANLGGFSQALTVSAGVLGNVFAGIELQGNRTVDGMYAGIQTWNGGAMLGAIEFKRAGANDAGAVHIYTAPGASGLWIGPTGDVGIGTTDPQSKLEVTGDIVATRSSYSSGYPAPHTFRALPLVVANTGPMTDGNNIIGVTFLGEDDAGNSLELAQVAALREDGAADKGALILATNPGPNSNLYPSEVVRISAAGNVGIGTQSPGVKLEVAGAVTVTGTGGNVPHGCTQRTATTTDNNDRIAVGCNSGEIVLGGGCSRGNADWAMRVSYPEGQGWKCVWMNNDADTKTAHAICCAQ